MAKILMAEYLDWNVPLKIGSHYYAEYFMKRHFQILWLTSPWHLFNLFSNRQFLHRRTRIWIRGGQKEKENFFVYSPFKILPYRNFGPLRWKALSLHGELFTLPFLPGFIKKRGFFSPEILWITNINEYAWLFDKLPRGMSVYRMADLHRAFKKNPPEIAIIEENIIRKADLVLVVSKVLQRRIWKKRTENVVYLPNGVDFERFDSPKKLPKEYEAIREPRAIYVGALDEWFDEELVAHLARRLPQLEIVLIGRKVRSLTSLMDLRNVHFLGVRMPESVPRYTQNAQVGLIPFKRTELTDYVHPLKLLEYMASGIPVVSTRLKELEELDTPARLASSKEEFVKFVEECISEEGRRREVYRNFARQNSWESRFDNLSKVLSPYSVG